MSDACPDCLHTRCEEGCVCNCDAARAEAEAASLRARISTLEARIAELERERDEAREQCRVALLNYSSADRRLVAEQLRGEHDRHAARADLDEAVRLLRDKAWPLLVGDAAPQAVLAACHRDSNLYPIAAYLALHPAQPETPDKETT